MSIFMLGASRWMRTSCHSPRLAWKALRISNLSVSLMFGAALQYGPSPRYPRQHPAGCTPHVISMLLEWHEARPGARIGLMLYLNGEQSYMKPLALQYLSVPVLPRRRFVLVFVV